ncbi:uracil-DNA glycosylase family protein [Neokomagataea thailandica]|uniref:Uracil-DNA glycosylase-like domain-containing protein n=1 Tax=Neokomagataea tanensis NBRC 106556 TaxID=1223519 RepID=A0ABQ0QGG5_9PROT|nr:MULTISPECIES: hypothetical protein [Neokomagataea]GBR43835.1 hypothetical protein AA106556_0229 [Neokomagataea tanensis NBRC 106556]
MTYTLPSEALPPTLLAPSEGSTPLLSSPSILIVAIGQTLSQAHLKDILEARGIGFSPSSSLHPYACFSQANVTVTSPIAQPNHLKNAKHTLQHELNTLPGLQLVIAIGLSTHITLMEACGVTLSRQIFYPNTITRLPDGLLVAHLPSPGTTMKSSSFTRMITALDELLPDIENALTPHA